LTGCVGHGTLFCEVLGGIAFQLAFRKGRGFRVILPMSHSTRFLTAAFIAVVGSFSASAQSSAGLMQRLDSIAGAEVRANRSVGIVAAAFKGRDKLLLQAYGTADVEGNAPMTVATMIPIGSVTKQFTAVAILQLRDQGKLSLDDEVTKWLPEVNVEGNRITLRQILAHTAGIPEASDMPELRAIQLIRNATLTRDSVYRVISRHPPEFPAGTLEMYSNTGYWLLGRIVEKESGVSYEEYVEKRIFAPLRMSRSMFCDNSKPVPDRANGYGVGRGTPSRIPDVAYTPALFAAGGICSTAGDLITWLQALHGGKVLSPRSYAELMAPAKLNDGTSLRYSMGMTIAEDSHGLRYVGHNGGGFGFSSETRWYPAAQLAIVVLTNSEPDAITVAAEGIAAAVLPAPPRAVGSFTGDPAPLLGKYKGAAHGGDVVVVVAQAPQGLTFSINGQPAEPLPWVEGWTFRKRDELLSFRFGPSPKQATELHYDTVGDHLILKPVAATAATMAAPLTAFEGTYEGPQPGTTVRVAVENDTLRVLPSGGGKLNLIPESGTTFYNGREGSARMITFNLGPDGKAISMTLKGAGTERTLKKLP
jgi:CubicO group peptidase (beta-lactamase class C family)